MNTSTGYTLTLDANHRRAIDRIGNRYRHGNDLASILIGCLTNDQEWDSNDDIEFDIPEHMAWGIMDIAEECEHRWDCFDRELHSIMENFVDEIV
jgi:hypothetical protein